MLKTANEIEKALSSNNKDIVINGIMAMVFATMAREENTAGYQFVFFILPPLLLLRVGFLIATRSLLDLTRRS